MGDRLNGKDQRLCCLLSFLCEAAVEERGSEAGSGDDEGSRGGGDSARVWGVERGEGVAVAQCSGGRLHELSFGFGSAAVARLRPSKESVMRRIVSEGKLRNSRDAVFVMVDAEHRRCRFLGGEVAPQCGLLFNAQVF